MDERKVALVQFLCYLSELIWYILMQPNNSKKSSRLYCEVGMFLHTFVEHLNQKFWMQISKFFYGVLHIFDGELFSYPVV